MKKSLLVLCLTLMASIGAIAYAQPKDGKGRDPRASFEEFMAQRIHFFIDEIKLNDEDSAKFVVVYKELLKEKGELMRKYHLDREIWQKIRNGETLSDELYMKMVETDAKLQAEDAQLELTYVERFSKVLTPKQLFDYRQAEKKFRSNFMRGGRKTGDKKGK